MKGLLRSFSSAVLAGIITALLFFEFQEHIGGWKLIVLVVSFPIIFWLAQMIVDLFVFFWGRFNKRESSRN